MPAAELGLGPDQQELVFAGWREAYQRVRSLRAEAAEARAELLELLEAEEPDERAIAAQREKLERLQREIRHLVMEQFIQTQKKLTPQQRRRWLEMMRARGRRWGWREHRRHMPNGHVGPPPPMGPMPMHRRGSDGPPPQDDSFHWRGEGR
jgi:Spy/CpxP family protein refolding chaperone